LKGQSTSVVDDKRIPTYERRQIAGTDLKIGKYGYILVSPMDDENDAVVRKITPFQRRCILVYYVETHNNEPIKIRFLAKKLGCEVRTIQYDLRYLAKKGYITIHPSKTKNGGTAASKYEFYHELESEFYDYHPTFEKVYGKKNVLALREWHWDDYKMIPGMNDYYHNSFDKHEAVEELNKKKRKLRKTESERLGEVRSPILKRHP